MTTFEKLKSKLAELFQLDQADLDFGIYRIMNARREEINQFLENDLLPQVQSAFEIYKSSDREELQKELNRVMEGVKAAGMDPEDSPKVNELREKLAEYGVDTKGMENDVYDHLYSFFSRYYHEGDFISLRRYKEGVYAIPYEGEEVKLHWANHDQYYIKTSEYFKDYTYTLPRVGKVHFKIVEADTEKDNVKSTDEKDRRFILCEEEPISETDDELIIRMEYRVDRQKRKQDAINSETVRKVLDNLNNKDFAPWFKALSEKWKNAKGESSEKNVMEKHLTDYTKRNTFDYFIHKDLEGFLKRELDFYIKNEVMRLDDIESESAARVEQYLSKIKVIRRIAHKIIAFLAQIEEFQKKLWLKKKFVIDTNYCVTLDMVPEAFYPEIINNVNQQNEWIILYKIDDILADTVTVGYTDPVTIEFLKQNDKLVLDTKFFSNDFKSRLLAALNDIDEQCDGLLINSENFQALGLISERHAGDVNCTYIDPPYNAKFSEVLYKNEYKHSSWLSLMSDRLQLSQKISSDDGVHVIAIDENEQERLGRLLDGIFPNSVKTCVTVVHNPGGIQGKNFSYSNEYAYFVYPDSGVFIGPRNIDNPNEVPLRDWGGDDSKRESAKNCFYPIFVKHNEIIGFGDVCEDSFHPEQNEKQGDDIIAIYPIDSDGVERKWRNARNTIDAIKTNLLVKDRNGVLSIVRLKSEYRYKTVWDDSRYNSNVHGSKLLGNIQGDKVFAFPKSLYTVQDAISATTYQNKSGIILDYFAGSGTTAHAVINQNKEDSGHRKYILVEMGEYFDSVTKPRIKKVIYSNDWKNGVPTSREGQTHMFKYLTLESYEDTLANIELQRDDTQQELISMGGEFQESYLLNYLLDVESKGSLLNINQFEDPWNYMLMVGQGSVGETKPVNIDLIETFNWLIGLKVKHIDVISGYTVIEGTNPSNDNVLIIWRKIRDLSESDPAIIAKLREQANSELEAFFKKQQYNTLDSEYDIIYVNGDNNLMNVPLSPDKKAIEPRYKVRLIEEEFQKLMFDTSD